MTNQEWVFTMFALTSLPVAVVCIGLKVYDMVVAANTKPLVWWSISEINYSPGCARCGKTIDDHLYCGAPAPLIKVDGGWERDYNLP